MTERELWSYFGKKIRITCIDNTVIEGKAEYFTKAIDNNPEVVSIGIPYSDNGLYDITTDEIKKIEIIE